jgi:HD-GYP domain-containing protein (c-di-GMP phosphodiesterase class II)
MKIMDDVRAGLSPAGEELLEGYDRQSPEAMPRRELVVEAATAVAFLVAASLMASLIPGQRELDPLLAGALVAMYALMSNVRFAARHGFTVPTQLVFVPMLFMLPAGTVPLFVAAGILASTLTNVVLGRLHATRVLSVPGDAWHSIGPALVIALAGSPEPSLSEWALLLGAFGAQLLLDNVVSSLRDWLGLGIPPSLEMVPLAWVALVDLLLSPIGLLAAMAAAAEPYAVLLVLPLGGLLAIFAAERSARLRQALELSRAYRGTTLLLGDVLEADDEYTGVHSQGVVALSVAVADAMGLDSRERRNVEFGALLHDIGKIAVPKEIINKPGPLTEDEWLVVRTHTIEGQRMLDQVGGLLSEVGRIVRSSHEAWDGSGYPDGLSGREIPMAATIVACCDAFNAMTTDRPYRPAMTTEEAVAELTDKAGSQFNPAVVRALLRVLDRPAPGARRPGIHAVAVPASDRASASPL